MPLVRAKLTVPMRAKLGITLNSATTPAPTISNIVADGEFAAETGLPDATYYVLAATGPEGELPLANLQTHLLNTRPLELQLATTLDEVGPADHAPAAAVETQPVITVTQPAPVETVQPVITAMRPMPVETAQLTPANGFWASLQEMLFF